MERKVVLVHGYAVTDEVRSEVARKLGSDPILTEHYDASGYMLTIGTNFPIGSIYEAGWYIDAIYEAEPDMGQPPDRPNNDYPTMVGTYNPPIQLITENEDEFTFIGAVWGTEEDGTGRYQE